MKPILQVENISKSYDIQHLTGNQAMNFRERIGNLFRSNMESESFHALKNISFDVMPGESLGIIGRNGAGKSTLLKILSKITRPSTGKIIARGRIASLLEVGTGFHPELTGRENIFFNGSLLGMKKKEIESKFDEIVDFSGTEKFLDSPLKHYSSGMQLRLAFAVAAFLEPEILIIDEVLAVGDAEFQKRCLGKMEDVTKNGRTILFVSHNMTAVRSLCPKGMLIDRGSIAYSGTSSHAIDHYLSLSNQDIGESGVFDLTKHNGKKDPLKGIKTARLIQNGKTTSTLFAGSPVKMEFDFDDANGLGEIVFGVVIKDNSQQPLIGINNWDLAVKLNTQRAYKGTLVFDLDALPLYGESMYYIDLYFGDGGNNYDTIENALWFRLEPSDVFGTGKKLNTKVNSVLPGKVKMFNVSQ